MLTELITETRWFRNLVATGRAQAEVERMADHTVAVSAKTEAERVLREGLPALDKAVALATADLERKRKTFEVADVVWRAAVGKREAFVYGQKAVIARHERDARRLADERWGRFVAELNGMLDDLRKVGGLLIDGRLVTNDRRVREFVRRVVAARAAVDSHRVRTVDVVTEIERLREELFLGSERWVDASDVRLPIAPM